MSKSNDKTFGLDQYIGIRVKQARLASDLKIADVAALSGISQGMVSKIENAQVATSLETLQRLCGAIGMSLSQLFQDFDKPDSDAHFTKAGQGLEVVGRGTQRGHKYHLLAYQRGSRRNVEPFFITMDDLSEVFPTFSHAGEEFIYLTEGKLLYQHGNSEYLMEPGDSLVFDGKIPHGPLKLLQVPVGLISVIHYNDE